MQNLYTQSINQALLVCLVDFFVKLFVFFFSYFVLANKYEFEFESVDVVALLFSVFDTQHGRHRLLLRVTSVRISLHVHQSVHLRHQVRPGQRSPQPHDAVQEDPRTATRRRCRQYCQLSGGVPYWSPSNAHLSRTWVKVRSLRMRYGALRCSRGAARYVARAA